MDTVLTVLLVLNTHWTTLASKVAELEQSFQLLRIEITPTDEFPEHTIPG